MHKIPYCRPDESQAKPVLPRPHRSRRWTGEDQLFPFRQSLDPCGFRKGQAGFFIFGRDAGWRACPN
jgi:hypothetical protein